MEFYGVDKVVIKLYTEDGQSTEYTTITGADSSKRRLH